MLKYSMSSVLSSYAWHTFSISMYGKYNHATESIPIILLVLPVGSISIDCTYLFVLSDYSLLLTGHCKGTVDRVLIHKDMGNYLVLRIYDEQTFSFNNFNLTPFWKIIATINIRTGAINSDAINVSGKRKRGKTPPFLFSSVLHCSGS